MRKQNKRSRNIQWKVILPVLLLLLLGLGLILIDRERILRVLGEADWKHLPGALFFVIVSNLLVSLSYIILARLIGIHMKRVALGAAFFTTNTMNRLVRSGGAAGFSLRYLMMKRHGVGLEDVLNSSFIHFLLGGLIMLGTLPLVILYILARLPVPAGTIPALILLAVVGSLIGVGISWVLFSAQLRLIVTRIGVWLAKKVARRDLSSLADEFNQRAAWAVTALRRDPGRFGLVMLLLFGEWVGNVLVLSFCLQAFGQGLSFGGTAALFVVPTTVGVFAALPGGIGVQEAVMTSLAVLHGLSFEQAALAAILYRILQSVLPYLISVGFYPRLLSTDSADTPSSEAAVD